MHLYVWGRYTSTLVTGWWCNTGEGMWPSNHPTLVSKPSPNTSV